MTNFTLEKLIGKKILATTEEWFYAPDGKNYLAIHGTLKEIHIIDGTGLRPTRGSANYILEIGNTFINGCQINYIVQCDTVNQSNEVDTDLEFEGKFYKTKRQNRIYITV